MLIFITSYSLNSITWGYTNDKIYYKPNNCYFQYKMPYIYTTLIYSLMCIIKTTRLAGGLHKGYKPKGYRPASKGAGFHSVQARPLTRRHPLKGICTTCHPYRDLHILWHLIYPWLYLVFPVLEFKLYEVMNINT